MNVLTFFTSVISTYYAMAVIQTVLHRIFGHRNRVRRIFVNHAMGHHAKYSTENLMSDRYIDSETYVMFYYLVPAAVISAFVYLLGGWLVVGGYAVGIVFAFWLHLYLHEHYHLKDSYLQHFAWFRKKRELHFVHHRSVRKNYAIVEYWVDSIMGTRQNVPGETSKRRSPLALAMLLAMLPTTVAFSAPDIAVQKTVNNAFPAQDEPVEFTVTVSNVGDEMAMDVVVLDQLPSGMAIPAGTAPFTSVGTYDTATGEWQIGDMNPDTNGVLSVPAVVTEPLPPACIVNIASAQFDDSLLDANDSSRAAVHQPGIERCVDLDVNFGISAHAPILVFPTCDSRDRYSGDVDVSNHGPDVARDVRVTLLQSPIVGPNLRFDDAACTNAPSTLCQIDSIGVGETVTIAVTSDLYQSYNSVTQTISVSASTSDTDYDSSNNDPESRGSVGGFSSCVEQDFGIPDVGIPAGCFIATAAYGTPMHENLDTLREFRDRFLVTNRPGQAIVSFYYRYSPVVADFISERDWLRMIVRILLVPVVLSIERPLVALVALLGFVAMWRNRRWLWKRALLLAG